MSDSNSAERSRDALSLKDLIAIASVVVALASAVFAYQARQAAQRFAEREFQSETTLRILETAFTELAAAPSDETGERKQRMACFFVVHLAEAEKEYRTEEPYLVTGFFDSLVSAGLVESACLMRSEGLSDLTPTASEISGPATTSSDGPPEIGTWHALIASYDVTDSGCRSAREDVGEFSQLLSGQGLNGLFLYIARTQISNNYAVTVDAGSDRTLAQRVSRIIRARSAESADGRTGADSFVQGNRDWYIDDDCVAFARLSD